jgi:hypothetical protein
MFHALSRFDAFAWAHRLRAFNASARTLRYMVAAEVGTRVQTNTALTFATDADRLLADDTTEPIALPVTAATAKGFTIITDRRRQLHTATRITVIVSKLLGKLDHRRYLVFRRRRRVGIAHNPPIQLSQLGLDPIERCLKSFLSIFLSRNESHTKKP